MRVRVCSFRVSLFLSAACATSAIAQSPSPGIIATDEGGAPGYQHSMERSRFVTGTTGAALRRVEEHGFSKVVGPDGVFATNLRNGFVMAVQNGGSDKGEAKAGDVEPKAGYVMDPDKHNQQVVDYFLSSGVQKDQIGGVHATTYLSASGSRKDAQAARPKIDGYASVLERKIENFPVVDSVAWARMNEQGKVVSERIYRPAIPAKALADARRLLEMTAGDSGKTSFLARLPAGSQPGKVVIRHTSATAQEPFEVFASYDIVERKATPEPGAEGRAPLVVSVVKHFDVDGVERRLPQERRNVGADYPKEKQPPQTAPIGR
jgi:hypothetical protein